jgi:hypothetical protein
MNWTITLERLCEECSGSGKEPDPHAAEPLVHTAPNLLASCPKCNGARIETTRVSLPELKKLLEKA